MSHLWLTRPVSSKATATSLVTGAWNPPRAANCSWSSSLGVWHKPLQSPGSFGSPQASTYCCRFFSGVRWSRKSKELWCQFLYCICWKAPDGRKSMNKSLQGLKRAITGAHQWSGLRGTAESSEVTETQEEGGKKGFWDRLLWAEKKEPGLETDLGTPPEAEKMSSTVKRLWDPKIREREQWQSWRWVKWLWASSPSQEQRRKKNTRWGPAGLSVSEALRKKTKQLGWLQRPELRVCAATWESAE